MLITLSLSYFFVALIDSAIARSAGITIRNFHIRISYFFPRLNIFSCFEPKIIRKLFLRVKGVTSFGNEKNIYKGVTSFGNEKNVFKSLLAYGTPFVAIFNCDNSIFNNNNSMFNNNNSIFNKSNSILNCYY